MTPAVLMLTSVYDFSADLVALKLKEKNVSFLRINKEHLHDYRFSLSPVLPLLTIESRLEQEPETWHIDSSIKSVWFRQPVFLRNTPANSLSIDEQLSRSQWSAFLRALSVFDHAAWMNWPQSTYLAESKPYQLLVASRCGFKIPNTIVGNIASIKDNEQAIIKSLDTVLLIENDDCLFTYSILTGKLSEEEVVDAPFVIQEFISNKVDVRVTVIGNNISAVKILSNGNYIDGDWRIISKELLQYEDIILPEPVAKSCMALVLTLGLEFAAIDLLERKGCYYFLEVNPTGEWGWLNDAKRCFDALIADWLANPPKTPMHSALRSSNV